MCIYFFRLKPKRDRDLLGFYDSLQNTHGDVYNFWKKSIGGGVHVLVMALRALGQCTWHEPISYQTMSFKGFYRKVFSRKIFKSRVFNSSCKGEEDGVAQNGGNGRWWWRCRAYMAYGHVVEWLWWWQHELILGFLDC